MYRRHPRSRYKTQNKIFDKMPLYYHRVIRKTHIRFIHKSTPRPIAFFAPRRDVFFCGDGGVITFFPRDCGKNSLYLLDEVCCCWPISRFLSTVLCWWFHFVESFPVTNPIPSSLSLTLTRPYAYKRNYSEYVFVCHPKCRRRYRTGWFYCSHGFNDKNSSIRFTPFY